MGAGKHFGRAAGAAAPFRGRLRNPKTNHIAPCFTVKMGRWPIGIWGLRSGCGG